MSRTVEAQPQVVGSSNCPVPAVPIANYVPFTRSNTGAGSIVVISGQIPFRDGKMHHVGQLGGGMSVEDAQEAGSSAPSTLLAQLPPSPRPAISTTGLGAAALSGLGGFVNCTPDFTQPAAGRSAAPRICRSRCSATAAQKHARTAVGVVPSLLGGESRSEVECDVRNWA